MKVVTKKAETVNLQPLRFYQAVNLGADPEFFFSRRGKVVGSEKVLPSDGLYQDYYKKQRASGKVKPLTEKEKECLSKFVVDGVQAELNPQPITCRALFGNEIARCFRELKSELAEKHPDLAVDFSPLVKLSQEELDSLSESSKVFGCAPSTNVYVKGTDKTSKIEVDPKKYLGRSAGGHIHLGNAYVQYAVGPGAAYYKDSKDFLCAGNIGRRMEKALKEDTESLVKMLDIIVGNTCVLLDRDLSNAERRKNYGRAGEHRVKDYGIEYRTLSNFWLRSYQLMSFVTGMCRLTILMVEQSTDTNNYVKAIFDVVNMDDVVRAINENDFDLAYANFKKIEPILLVATDGEYYKDSFPIHKDTIKYFHHFVKQGIDYWFKESPIEHWTTLPDGHGRGFELFLMNRVCQDAKYKGIDLNDPKNLVAKDPSPKKTKRIVVGPKRFVRRIRAVKEEVSA